MPDFPTFDTWLPQPPAPPRPPAPPYALRHVRDSDMDPLEARVRDWREERHGGGGPGRTWFRHFGGASLVAETLAEARPLGVLLGFRSVDRPDEAVIHVVAVDPAVRRRGVGRDLVARFGTDMASAGATTLSATCRPDDKIALAFFSAIGFVPEAGPGSARLYGVPAFADWDGPGEDRVLLLRPITG